MNTMVGRSNVEATVQPQSIQPEGIKERIAFRALLIVYLIVQLINLGRGGHKGQDWSIHQRWLHEAATYPLNWLEGNTYQTNPPLYHLLMAPFSIFFRQRFAYEAIGLTNVLISLATLWVLWLTLKLVVDSVWIRFAALLTVAFLPAFVIGSEVIATDAFSQLPVCILALCFALYAKDKIRWYLSLIVATLAVLFSIGTKSTAIVLIPATALAFLVIAGLRNHWHLRFFAGLVMFVVVTGPLSLFLNFHHPSNFMNHFEQSASVGQKPPELMNLRSIVWFRRGDRLLWNAPTCWELSRAVPPSLSISNTFSYPGLVCFGLHTDMTGVLQPQKRPFAWGYFGIRTPLSRMISRISVRIGFVTFCFSIVGTVLAGAYATRLYFSQSDRVSTAILAILIVALSWLATMSVIVGTVSHAYLYQYWHPRLLLPAVVLFAIPVAWITSVLLKDRRWQIALMACCIVQAFVHLGVILGR